MLINKIDIAFDTFYLINFSFDHSVEVIRPGEFHCPLLAGVTSSTMPGPRAYMAARMNDFYDLHIGDHASCARGVRLARV